MNPAITNIQDRINAAKIALRRGDAIAAIAALTAGAMPSDSEGMELLGMAYSLAGNHESALDAMQRATHLNRTRASAHYNFALLLSKNPRNLDEAVEENQT